MVVAILERTPLLIPPIDELYYTVNDKRFGRETHDIREWITPHSAKVVDYAAQLWDDDRDIFILNCWEWFSRSFEYSCSDIFIMRANICDHHWAEYRQEDLWEFPAETIARYEESLHLNKRPMTDCDGGTFLLASLLLSGTDGVYANVGYVWDRGQNRGHAWVTVERNGREYIIETTFHGEMVETLLSTNPWMKVEDYPEYRVWYKFDHKNVVKTP